MTWLYTRPIRPRFLWLRLRIYFLKTFMWLQTRAKNKSTIKLRKAKAPVLLCSGHGPQQFNTKKTFSDYIKSGLGKSFLWDWGNSSEWSKNTFRVAIMVSGFASSRRGLECLAWLWGEGRQETVRELNSKQLGKLA